ncbi:hypothetical protein NDU88_001054 [Pleurodeles waltl]|uniref:Uncharacterized protein n=1 Tax=Pleurodeles waltl TaxID=8319 RepID=A0AAV7VAN9_PLEWA|nr:hypothetical protein NDU88_001054 [Pleurodeles waltl]
MTTPTPHIVCGETRRPTLGLRTYRSQGNQLKKGPQRAPRPGKWTMAPTGSPRHDTKTHVSTIENIGCDIPAAKLLENGLLVRAGQRPSKEDIVACHRHGRGDPGGLQQVEHPLQEMVDDLRRCAWKTAEAQLEMASQRVKGARRNLTPLMAAYWRWPTQSRMGA